MKIYIGAIFLALSFKVSAGSVTSKIDFVQTNVTGSAPESFLIKFVSPPSGQPGCAGDDRMIADLQTESGKAIMSMALAAKLADKDVFVGGANSCTHDYEKIHYMRLL